VVEKDVIEMIDLFRISLDGVLLPHVEPAISRTKNDPMESQHCFASPELPTLKPHVLSCLVWSCNESCTFKHIKTTQDKAWYEEKHHKHFKKNHPKSSH
jgi:hypothetical protein